MRAFLVRCSCAALLFASTGCIIDRGTGARQESAPDDDDDGTTPVYHPPPRAPATPRPAPQLAQPEAPPAPSNPVANRADQADQELDRESENHQRPVISNLDEDGYPIAGTTGTPQPETEPGGDDSAVGAPGANATPGELDRAWPGAKPLPNASPDGTADEPAPPLPPATALPYSAPGDTSAQPQTASESDTPPPAGTEMDQRAFEKPLRGYGRWVETPDYGRVWIPYVDSDWQPYSDGTWTDTEYGWAFTSYDPWGWAVWHYGSWGFRTGIGWYWVPGRVWGPAWVSWRWGGGYACWRPIAPWGAWGARWGNRGWVGVSAAHFTEPIRGGNVLRGSSIRVAVSRSQALPGPVARPVAGNAYGPPVGSVSQAVGRPITARPATQVVRNANIAARSAAAQEGRASARESAPAQRSQPGAARPAFRDQIERGPRAQAGANQNHQPHSNWRGAAPGAGSRTRGNVNRGDGAARGEGTERGEEREGGHGGHSRGHKSKH